MKKFLIILCLTSSLLCMTRIKKEDKKAKRGSIELNEAISSQLTLLNTYARDRKTEFNKLAQNQEKTNERLQALIEQAMEKNYHLKQITIALNRIVEALNNSRSSDSYSSDFASDGASPEPRAKSPFTLMTVRSTEPTPETTQTTSEKPKTPARNTPRHRTISTHSVLTPKVQDLIARHEKGDSD